MISPSLHHPSSFVPSPLTLVQKIRPLCRYRYSCTSTNLAPHGQ